LRVVDHLEAKYADFPGLNLTFETREGILKHCSARNARELGDLGRRFLDRQQPGLEAQIANLADAIAYNNHDVDDGFRAGLLSLSQLREQALFAEQYETVHRLYPQLEDRRLIYEIIRRMINCVVTDLIDTTSARLKKVQPDSIDAVRAEAKPLVTFSSEVFEKHTALKRFLSQNLYRHENVRSMTDKARDMVEALFECYMSNPGEMPAEFATQTSAADNKARVVADYIAGMTDRFAISEFERLS
jgi:dGTPase